VDNSNASYFRDDLLTEEFRRDIIAAIERGEITQEAASEAKVVEFSTCCHKSLTQDLRCSLCQKEHRVIGAEYIIDQDNRLHLVVESHKGR
jgi:hypothetical protein